MARRFAYIICSCTEQSFIHAFNFLEAAIRKTKQWDHFEADAREFRFLLCETKKDDIAESVIDTDREKMHLSQFLEFDARTFSETCLILTVNVKETPSPDVFSYRYLLLIKNIFMRQDDEIILLSYGEHYHKILSYFALDNMPQLPGVRISKNDAGYVETAPDSFSLSSEWLPAFFLSGKSSELYEVLANPLFSREEDIAASLSFRSNRANRIYPKLISEKSTTLRELQRQHLRLFFTSYLNGDIADYNLADDLFASSGIAQLLFALIFRNIKRNNAMPSAEEAKRLLCVCCDLSDGILQVGENMVSHTNGGILSIRINDDWNKVKNTYHIEDNANVGKWYLRISLTDFSEKSIIDNVRTKSGIVDLSLPHIFHDDSALSSLPKELYDKIEREYSAYMANSEHIIHHYGLSVFKSIIVDQYHGAFSLISRAETTSTENDSYYIDSDVIKHTHLSAGSHIPGSHYEIIIPLSRDLFKPRSPQGSPSLSLTPDYIVPYFSYYEIFTSEITEYFNAPLSRLVRKFQSISKLPHQQLKETVVNEASKQLAERMLNAVNPSDFSSNKGIFYFFLSEIADQVFGRTEIVAKILLQTIDNLRSTLKIEHNTEDWLRVVVYGLNENKLELFTRQFALFYHRREGNRIMKGCKLLLVSRGYDAEVLFDGVRLNSIAGYNRSRLLVTGTSPGAVEILEYIAKRDTSVPAVQEDIHPFPFELLKRMELGDGGKGKKVILSEHNRWFHANLEKVIHNDIHGPELGCCIKNIHVRVGDMHQHTFYECQLLFSNAYWRQIFSHYICAEIIKQINGKRIGDKTDILLYGYETYSEQMLYAIYSKLNEYLNNQSSTRKVFYCVYENPKYITSSETSERRVRYIEQFFDEGSEDLCVVYINGIGTTLRTISVRMKNALEEQFQHKSRLPLLEKAYKIGMTVIQISDEEKGDDSSGVPSPKMIQCREEEHTVTSIFSNLDFLDEKKCHYLIEIPAKLEKAEECSCCINARDYIEEQPLIQTNETSTVPMLLIKPTVKKDTKARLKIPSSNCDDNFFRNPRNANYIYYAHLDRNGSHHQVYIRTASLLRDLMMHKDVKFDEWLRKIKELEDPSLSDDQDKNVLNFIVSPLHFSNESLAVAVNTKVFGGSAYVLNFDVRKEFRDSFVAKFQNYPHALDILRAAGNQKSLVLNFYFVDDTIQTGATYHRAKSLVSSMLGKYRDELPGQSESGVLAGIEVRLFKAIILLVNRNSVETLRTLCDPCSIEVANDGALVLPVYRFIEINTPSIRSYGDSCPLCNKLDRIHKLRHDSSLTYVERHWREKERYHRLKKLSDARHDKEKKDMENTKGDSFYKTRGLRRMYCSEIIWRLVKSDRLHVGNARTALEQEIAAELSTHDSIQEKAEFLFSFLKVISREHLVYQETIQPAAMEILLSILSIILNDGNVNVAKADLYRTVNDIMGNSEFIKYNPIIPYQLFMLVIARLCAMGSIVFCRKEKLIACLEKGLELQERIPVKQRPDPVGFIESFCIQIKKMLFATKDKNIRAKMLQTRLKECIEETQKYSGRFKEERLIFFSSMFIEAVSDETRTQFVKNMPVGDAAVSDTDKLRSFERKIQESKQYENIMASLCDLTNAKYVVMFQLRNQEPISERTDHWDVIRLADSTIDYGESFSLLRSEMIDFFRLDSDSGSLSCGDVLLDIRDSIRIVNVKKTQNDRSVGEYTREPCTIAYTRIDYIDHSSGNDPKSLYLAFVYPPTEENEKTGSLIKILGHLQGFLSFRDILVKKIEDDFNGNLYARQIDEAWRSYWLSIEKAGAHTDSTGISRILKNTAGNNYSIFQYLFNPADCEPIANRDYLRLIYNITIAMYYRAVISREDKEFKTADNIETRHKDMETLGGAEGESGGMYYERIGDLVKFKEIDNPRITFGNGQNAEDINSAYLYSKPCHPNDEKFVFSGMPARKEITFSKKYLKAFLVDILCNIEAYGMEKKAALIYTEFDGPGPGYLVFRNAVKRRSCDIPDSSSYLEKNYKLKQALEFDNTSRNTPKGISLGCISHCVKWAGVLKVEYDWNAQEQCEYFTIKLPIIKSTEGDS